jgi:hypothetical protein
LFVSVEVLTDGEVAAILDVLEAARDVVAVWQAGQETALEIHRLSQALELLKTENREASRERDTNAAAASTTAATAPAATTYRSPLGSRGAVWPYLLGLPAPPSAHA